jgi:hypothetical protein
MENDTYCLINLMQVKDTNEKSRNTVLYCDQETIPSVDDWLIITIYSVLF